MNWYHISESTFNHFNENIHLLAVELYYWCELWWQNLGDLLFPPCLVMDFSNLYMSFSVHFSILSSLELVYFCFLSVNFLLSPMETCRVLTFYSNLLLILFITTGILDIECRRKRSQKHNNSYEKLVRFGAGKC